MTPDPASRHRYSLGCDVEAAKAERVIKSHQLEGIILPPAPRNCDPQPWTRKELGIIMGPALRALALRRSDSCTHRR